MWSDVVAKMTTFGPVDDSMWSDVVPKMTTFGRVDDLDVLSMRSGR